MSKVICAHMVVRNEDRFIWYAISSVLPYVDKFIIFDTGSTDDTVKIINLFKDSKILYKQKEKVNGKEMVDLRNEQIQLTRSDWIWIIDGDEIYPSKTVKSILKKIEGQKDIIGIIVQRYDLLGDIYHCQDEKIGVYNQFGRKGHDVLRLINKGKIAGLQVKGEYPNEYYADKDGQSIKKLGKEKFTYVEERIFHSMYLQRSSYGKSFTEILNRKKRKIELGRSIPKQEIPEVFFKEKPIIIPDVTAEVDLYYRLLAGIVTPIKQLKRKIVTNK